VVQSFNAIIFDKNKSMMVRDFVDAETSGIDWGANKREL